MIDVAGAGASPDEAVGPEHLPLRPLWRCGICTWPWPCPSARRRLTDTCPVLYLAIYLAGCYADALTDRPDLHPAVLYTRILGWVGPRTRTDDQPAPWVHRAALRWSPPPFHDDAAFACER